MSLLSFLNLGKTTRPYRSGSFVEGLFFVGNFEVSQNFFEAVLGGGAGVVEALFKEDQATDAAVPRRLFFALSATNKWHDGRLCRQTISSLNGMLFDPKEDIFIVGVAGGDGYAEGVNLFVCRFNLNAVKLQKGEHDVDTQPFVAIDKTLSLLKEIILPAP